MRMFLFSLLCFGLSNLAQAQTIADCLDHGGGYVQQKIKAQIQGQEVIVELSIFSAILTPAELKFNLAGHQITAATIRFEKERCRFKLVGTGPTHLISCRAGRLPVIATVTDLDGNITEVALPNSSWLDLFLVNTIRASLLPDQQVMVAEVYTAQESSTKLVAELRSCR